MNYFSIVSIQILTFIVYALIGVIAIKVKLYDKDGLNVISSFIIKISMPVMIFTNTINGATREEFIQSLPVLFTTVLMYIFLYLLSTALGIFSRLKGNEKNVYRACTMFGNIGFMGIPIISAVFPEHGMLYIALFTVIDQLVLWTIGVNLTLPVDNKEPLSAKARALKMINPATVGITLAVIFIFCNIHLPEFLNTALVKTGAITTPLAMIYLGGLFCYTDILQYLKHWEFYVTVVVKMCIFPLVFYQILKLIPGVTEEIVVSMSLLSALPTMSSVAMLAQNQKSAGEYGAGMIFVTTLCSIVTLPLVCFLIQ